MYCFQFYFSLYISLNPWPDLFRHRYKQPSVSSFQTWMVLFVDVGFRSWFHVFIKTVAFVCSECNLFVWCTDGVINFDSFSIFEVCILHRLVHIRSLLLNVHELHIFLEVKSVLHKSLHILDVGRVSHYIFRIEHVEVERETWSRIVEESSYRILSIILWSCNLALQLSLETLTLTLNSLYQLYTFML